MFMVIRMRWSSNWYADKKNVCSVCHTPSKTYYDSEIKRAIDFSSGAFRIYVEFEYRRVFCKKCMP
ncbi:putative transposase [Candidatus Kuenenia stuttgartiensis]|uniref:Putative transposase n=1 Tax=Kuenenia stuttgartiensis TaxID=174633 RepID=A0A6G7GIF3_KUEST|nr:putative transposase [Candidatus Kuenenia stuttgartiensis]